jgi:5'-methylthioadenosine phosphorylase
MVKIGIIGGSGLNNPDILQNASDYEVNTLYGRPSSPLKQGKIKDVDVVLLARHGRAHTIPPSQVNYRANIHALKTAGCTHILATTACGSLREEIGRGDLVILDQFIDYTRHRDITFYEHFESENPMHTPMADPFNSQLRQIFIDTCRDLGLKHHTKGTVITIEGPRFSTRAESFMFRQWGADVINMSIAPEAILANEAGIPYAAVAMSTDYDCWKEDEVAVTWEDVMRVFRGNVEKVTNLLIQAIPKIAKLEKRKVAASKKTPFKYEHLVRNVPDFPKKGIQFKDITTLIVDPEALQAAIKQMADNYRDEKVDMVVGIESRGFIFGTGIALALGTGHVAARKPGKLPAKTRRKEYALEYGTDAVEIHADAIAQGMRCLIVDDLVATGGTIKAVAELVEELGGEVVGLSVLIDLKNLHGDLGFPLSSLIEYEEEE